MGDARTNILEGILALALALLLVPEPARHITMVGDAGAGSVRTGLESPLVAEAASSRGHELRIRYVVSRPAQVAVGIFDLNGRPVRHLADQSATAGPHTVTWDHRDEYGQRVEPGVYYYRLSLGDGDNRNTLLVVN